MTDYYLDMGYKGYRTKCDVPKLVAQAIKNGINFIGIQTVRSGDTPERFYLININRCDAISYDGRAKEFNKNFISQTFKIAVNGGVENI